MKKIFIYTLGLAAILSSTSCEKVITVELNEADQKIVVDAIVSNDSAQNYVKLSKSGGFYQTNDFEAITGATVTIEEVGGATYTLTETTPGYYTDPTLIGQLQTYYNLTVTTTDQTVTGTTYVPDTTQLDSLSYFWNTGGFGDPGWFVLMNWTDDGNEENYYRFKTIVNGEHNDGINGLDDDLINGITTQYPLFDVELEDYDTLEVEFIEIDRTTYDYLRILSEIASGANASSAAPGNPENNLSGDALGFFGGYAISRNSVIIEP